MRRPCLAVLFSVLVWVPGWATDEFDAIECGADIPNAIVGRRSSDKRVVVAEARHRALGLEDLGGAIVSDRLFLSSWRICGGEFALLLNTGKALVQDVLPVPAHSLRSPLWFAEGCQLDGRTTPDAVVAILDNSQRQGPNVGRSS